MRKLLVVSCFVLCLSLLAVQANACSFASCLSSGIEMRRDFVVKIKHADKPLPGATVEIKGLQDNSRKRFSSTTAKDGSVHITNLAPGDYWLNAEFLGITAAYHCFHVTEVPSRKAKHALAFNWGDEAPATRRFAGKLVDSQPSKGGTPIWNLLHRIDVPIVGARLKLQNAIADAAYSATSDTNGTFAFDGIPNGIYVLHIDGGKAPPDREYETSDLLIVLDPSAKRNLLLLRRSEPSGGSCGGTSLELQDSTEEKSASPVSK